MLETRKYTTLNTLVIHLLMKSSEERLLKSMSCVGGSSTQAKYGCNCIKLDGASMICIMLKPPTAALIVLTGLLSQLISLLYKMKVF